MRKPILLLILLVLLTLQNNLLAPAYADSQSSPTANSTEDKNELEDAEEEDGEEGSKKKKATADCSLGKRTAAIMAGCTVGIPVAMFRRSVANTMLAAHDLVGEEANIFAMSLAVPFSTPPGSLGGCMEGIFYGIYNSVVYSDEPFSKDSFSLGDM